MLRIVLVPNGPKNCTLVKLHVSIFTGGEKTCHRAEHLAFVTLLSVLLKRSFWNGIVRKNYDGLC